MNFSLLMSIYNKEKPENFNRCMQSIWDEQSVRPSEIILVEDGKLTKKLYDVIAIWKQKLKERMIIVPLEKNVGLGYALNVGLGYCSNEFVARMDTDDIALPNRFAKQIEYMQIYPNVDIVGGWICEFEHNPRRCDRERRVPLMHHDIRSFARYRNPLNHMTVLFRKSAVEKSGGYLPMQGFEDYYLWMRMFQSGKQFANIPDVLVKARTGSSMIRRRQGLAYAQQEWKLEIGAYEIGFWSKKDLVINIVIRLLPRLLPVVIVEKLYNLLRKT